MKHLQNINYKTIPHKKHRYETCGDYFTSKAGMEFRVSRMEKKMEALVLIHEFIEWILCDDRGISIKSIDKFDTGEGKDLIEPGASKKSPYYNEHKFATKVEKQLSKELGVDWDEYEKKINDLIY